jgi:hypothetical protein
VGRGQDTGTLGVALRSANLLKMWLVTTAAMLAIYLLALGETTNTAEAEDSLPENGKIAFSNITGTSGMYEIYTVEPDGSGLSQLTNNVNLEAARIGSLLFVFADSPNDQFGFPPSIATFATRLSAQALT